MSTKATMQILQTYLNITSSTFSLHPLQIKYLDGKYLVLKATISWKTHLFWIIILALSITVTLFEIFLSFQHKNKNLFVILYHLVLLIVKLSSLLCFFVFNQKSNELAQLLLYFCQYSQSSVVTANETKRLQHLKGDAKFTCFFATFSILLTIFYIAILPTVPLFLPRLHPVLLIIPVDCKKLAVRLTAFMVQVFALAPTCGANCVAISVALVIVTELFTNLAKFCTYVKEISSCSTLNIRQLVGLRYRRIQLLIILCNECFQTLIWPAIEFFGAIVMTSLLYLFIVCFDKLPLSGSVVIFVSLTVFAFLVCITLDIGSLCMEYSSRILKQTKLWNECKWSRRFFKSCSLTSFKIGGFHNMTRGRVPLLLRFVLQRTFFLVFKTKLRSANGTSIVVSLP